MSEPPKHRWKVQGWTSYNAAHAAFRGIIAQSFENGWYPGEPLPSAFNDFLEWLLAGHPRAQELRGTGVRAFTFVANGRGKNENDISGYSFAVIDTNNHIRPFSVCDALTGKEHFVFFDEKNPFSGMRS